MRHKPIMPPWKLRRRDHQQRIGQAGARWDTLAALFAMPPQAAQERAGDAQAGTVTDASPKRERVTATT